MKIAICATDSQWNELTPCADTIEWIRITAGQLFAPHPDIDAFFILTNTQGHRDHALLKKPVFINEVSNTLKDMHASSNVLRFNGWPGFMQRPAWELAGNIDEAASHIFDQMGKKIIPVADEPGLVAGRIIGMIINEAFFAVEDGVCSKEEINTAMKLGTGYPHGPFEWAALIGTENILELLQLLSKTDKRYQPAPMLVKDAAEIKP